MGRTKYKQAESGDGGIGGREKSTDMVFALNICPVASYPSIVSNTF